MLPDTSSTTYTCAKQGNGWTALSTQRQGFELHLIQLYFRTGESLQSPLNPELLGQLLQFLDHLQAPFIVGGDWQTTVEELAATTIPCKFRSQILAAPRHSLQGSKIDFVLASSHCGLSQIGSKLGCALEAPLCTCPTTQLWPRRTTGAATEEIPTDRQELPSTQSLDQFTEDDGHFEMLGPDVARWATQTEKYLTQMLQTGRGSRVQLFQAPLLSSSKPEVWKKGSAAFWEKMG